MAESENKIVHHSRWKRWLVIIAASTAFIILLLCCGLILQFMKIFRILGFGTFGALDRATEAQEKGDLDTALYWSNVAVKRDSNFGVTYYTRGRILEAMGKFPEAIEDYSRANKCSYGGGGFYIDRGRAYEKLGQLDAAVRDYCKEIIRSPSSTFGPQSWAEQRAEREGLDTLDEMIEVFDSAIKNDPKNETFIKCRNILANAERFPRDNKPVNRWKENDGLYPIDIIIVLFAYLAPLVILMMCSIYIVIKYAKSAPCTKRRGRKRGDENGSRDENGSELF